MSDVTDQLEQRLDELARSAHTYRDIDGVRAGTRSTQPVPHCARSLSGRRVAVQIAAAAVVVVGGIGLIAVSAVDDPPSRAPSTTPASPEATSRTPALPVMPASPEGTQLMVDCLIDHGLDVRYDDSNGQPAITYDNRIVDDAAFEVAQASCNEHLVVSGEIYGLGPDAPTGPGIAVVPGTEQGTRLLGECLIERGLDVQIDARAISYDNRVVSHEHYDQNYDRCYDDLVAAGKIVPLRNVSRVMRQLLTRI